MKRNVAQTCFFLFSRYSVVMNIFLNNKHYLFMYSHNQCSINEDNYLPECISSKIIYTLRYYLTIWILRERKYFSFPCFRLRKNIVLLKGFLCLLIECYYYYYYYYYWVLLEWYWRKKTKLFGETPVLLPLDKPQIPQPSKEPRTLWWGTSN